MSYQIGDPNHIAVHNALIATLADMGATSLPDEAILGDAGHVADHNLIRAALVEIETAWGVTGTPLPPVAAAGNLGHVDDHNTIDEAIAYLNANGYNEATGGTVTDVPNYNGTGQTWRVHTFTANGSITIVKAIQPFRVLVAGGGAGAEGRNEGALATYGGRPGGGGQVYTNNAELLPVGSHTITVGAGGGGCGSANCYPSNGGASTLGGYTAQGGTTNTPGIPGTASDISGSSVTYGTSGSQAAAACRYCGPVDGGPHYPGQGGWGCNGAYVDGCCEANGLPGDAGTVIVAYRIA